VVTKIAYGADSVTYSTFDDESTDVLRVNFSPDSVTVGGKVITRRKDLEQQGYTFDDVTRVLTIRHTTSRDVDIQGESGQVPPSYITFDDPHYPAGTRLSGQYPSGVIDWGDDQWQIGTPNGKFGTFTLTLADPEAQHAQFSFYTARIFDGLDVYNGADANATILIRSPGIREISFTIKPKELRRLRTAWRDTSSQIFFDITNGQELRFDNLAYHR